MGSTVSKFRIKLENNIQYSKNMLQEHQTSLVPIQNFTQNFSDKRSPYENEY